MDNSETNMHLIALKTLSIKCRWD